MHSVIRIICYGFTEEDALEKAESIVENLTGDGMPFDYGTFFNEKSSCSGKSRWGNLPVIALADSKEGKKLIEYGFKYTKKEFFDNLKKVKDMINSHTEEELFEEKKLDVKTQILDTFENNKYSDLMMFKYYCSSLGKYKGSGVYLYDHDGEGIKNTRHLKDALNKWNSKDYEGMNTYVIPVDVHY